MWYRKQVKIQEVLTWQEFKHGTPYHVTLQASRPLDCCCKTSVMPLILKAQTLFFISHNHWVFHAAGSRWFIHLLEPDHQAAAGLEKTQLYQVSTTSRFWNPQCWAICINLYQLIWILGWGLPQTGEFRGSPHGSSELQGAPGDSLEIHWLHPGRCRRRQVCELAQLTFLDFVGQNKQYYYNVL